MSMRAGILMILLTLRFLYQRIETLGSSINLSGMGMEDQGGLDYPGKTIKIIKTMADFKLVQFM